MSKASLFITPVLLIVATVFVYANSRTPVDHGKLSFGQKPLENSDVFSADSIVFESGKGSFELKRDAFRRWAVTGKPTDFPIDETKLRSFMVQLMSMQVGDRIPGGESRPQVFEFPVSEPSSEQSTSKAGGRILLRDGQRKVTLFEIVSGKSRTAGVGMYARFNDKQDVYLIAENLAPLYDANHWRDKSILDVDSQGIAGIEFLAFKGERRIERARAADPWKEKSTSGARSILTPQFLKKTLPRLTSSLKELQFVSLMPRNPNDTLDKYKLSEVGFKLYSGKSYKVTLYGRPGSGPNSSAQYYATFHMQLVPGHSFGKYTSFGLASDVADFNEKGRSWLYVLDEASAQRFLVNADD